MIEKKIRYHNSGQEVAVMDDKPQAIEKPILPPPEANNFMEGNEEVTTNNWDGGVQPQGGSADISVLKANKATQP